jgi:hypothetical protein
MNSRSGNRAFILLPAATLLFSLCTGSKIQGEENAGKPVHRFDTDLYAWLQTGDTAIFSETNKLLLDVFAPKVIDMGTSDSPGFEERLRKYFSEPALWKLYADEQEKFKDITHINSELAHGMEILAAHFPALKLPRIYMHVSGLNQNVVVTGDILSLSADKYLGSDYPLYQDFFYDYQRQQMTPERIVPDYLLGFLMATFPMKGNADVLLDRMLHEGKLRYLLSRLLPDRKIWESTGYNEEQYRWCIDHEPRMWTLILENKHLFTPNSRITEQYIHPAPYTAFLPVESPGRAGIWLGFRIVSSYMKHHPQTSLSDLIAMTDYNELLKKAKYRP